ncbi:uncharacterized protein MONBRDRAFT_12589 [Monosiga brevicollis MX1]|uniref:Transmembrane protein n=1 Tax=Monosiga brevicollis TaxID=81824 RepID=A9VCQ8_MONBE|nr:uncharacterized protein MONBRDRAFT_12589 [Monosiga brevicollis MX1]EDQ84728.1 predicted protein [Monosiga brevicollis MX1]|eukprot:XP_001750514.1 hypothetical protein [Monosiga brevicollis MX1]
METVFWTVMGILFAISLKLTTRWHHELGMGPFEPGKAWPVIDRLLAVTHWGMIGYLLLVKYGSGTMLYILQPCHIVMVLQGTLLMLKPSRVTRGLLHAHFVLILGAFVAIVLPDTDTLEAPFEVEVFFIQHFLIVFVTPLRLLKLHDGGHWRWISVLGGLCIMHLMHWPFYVTTGSLTHVNLQFMQCPTVALAEILKELPPWVITPSYRSLVTILYHIVAIGVAAGYLELGRFLFTRKTKSS